MNEIKVRTCVSVGKPPKDKYIRVRPEAEASYPGYLLEVKGHGAGYLIDPSLHTLLREHVRPTVLRLAVDKQGDPYLIPVMLPGADIRLHPWVSSRNRAVQVAETRWVRLVPNLAKADYQVFAAAGDLGEPEWPEEPIEELVRIAFEGRIIDNADHPLVKQVLGR